MMGDTVVPMTPMVVHTAVTIVAMVEEGGGEVGGVDLLGTALVLGTGITKAIYQNSGGIWDGSGFHGGGYHHGGGFRHAGGYGQQGFQKGFQEGGGYRQGGGSQHSEENGKSGSDSESGQKANEDKKSNIYNIGNGRENQNTVNIYLNKCEAGQRSTIPIQHLSLPST
ncbi:uncharacterized protein LOC126781867 isoform X4 [Nymphalis io]|uniref:uncharacterized protein LOC126781867 isoform X4 n=1 Tax=Inachis io TaxID=171585 RepID=UPI0021693330|nr:uncharacterized protein LOC126781867 isoform X4 [Nymphalis io]